MNKIKSNIPGVRLHGVMLLVKVAPALLTWDISVYNNDEGTSNFSGRKSGTSIQNVEAQLIVDFGSLMLIVSC